MLEASQVEPPVRRLKNTWALSLQPPLQRMQRTAAVRVVSAFEIKGAGRL